jgi:hypothetical protein
MHLLVSTHSTPIAIVEIDSSCAVNRIHATHFWETTQSTLAGFIECGNGSDLRMGASPLPNSTMNKNLRFSKPYRCRKMVFLASKTLLSLSGAVEKNFFFNFECYDLTNGNECVRFGRHVDIQVSYKILQLEVLKDNPILDTSPSFQ